MSPAFLIPPPHLPRPARSARSSNPLTHLRPHMSTPTPPVDIPPHLQPLRILGLGVACMDLVATVDQYPRPDQKIRTNSLHALGGGNMGNTLTAVRRLGLRTTLLSKLGTDVYGTAILKELQADGIDTSAIVVKPTVTTTLTYVIVDSGSNTRTCISTPSNEDLFPEELDQLTLQSLVEQTTVVALDGRHTRAALRLADVANANQVPVLLDIERDRPFVRELLLRADYIITNSRYPLIYAPDASDRIDAMIELTRSCRARFVISTLGEAGCIMVMPKSDARERSTGLDVMITSRTVKSRRSRDEYEVIECPAWPVAGVVDSTGAGDAFIGGIIYGIATSMPVERMLSLAIRVAAAKLTGIGARTALPRREDLPDTLFATLPTLG